ncbi:YwdI family protein [Fredinandcohnia humi]
MNISVMKIIEKMQQELVVAKQEQNEQKIRERLMAIRTLCDLVLDEATSAVVSTKKVVASVMPQPTPIVASTKLEEDDANGDSLFDF